MPSARPVRRLATARAGMTIRAAPASARPAGDCPGWAWMASSIVRFPGTAARSRSRRRTLLASAGLRETANQ
jgi:hypothetical protein